MKKSLLSLLVLSTLSLSFSHLASANFSDSKSVTITGEVTTTDTCTVEPILNVALPKIDDKAKFDNNGLTTSSPEQNIIIRLSECNFDLSNASVSTKIIPGGRLSNVHGTDTEKAKNVGVTLIQQGEPLDMSKVNQYDFVRDDGNKGASLSIPVNYLKLDKDDSIGAGMIRSIIELDIKTSNVND